MKHTTKQEELLVALLKEKKLTVTTVESCTGGLVAASITSVAGSSAVLKRAYITYCDEAKHEMVGVKSETLQKYTAVSRDTAAEMAQGGAREAKADCCISVTGYAGPPSGCKEPVGLVYIGCFVKGQTEVKECHFDGDRAQVRKAARETALQMLTDAVSREAERSV